MSLQIPDPSNKKRVIVIGGGFAGIKVARHLLCSSYFQIVLFDRNNFHTFQPLLYQVATGALEPDSVVYPLRSVFHKKKDFFFRIAEVNEIDAAHSIVKTNLGDLSYDYLVIATGASTNYFGMNNVQQHAMPLKSITDALDIRSAIIQNLEKAILETDPAALQSLLTIVIAGGGPTGVEMAGAIAELRRSVFPEDYPELDLKQMKIVLVEAAGKLLSTMSEKSSVNSLKVLRKMGVDVKLSSAVKDYSANEIILASGEKILSSVFIWTAGVKGAVINGIPQQAVAKSGRVNVDAFNKVDGSENIFAIGDVALLTTDKKYPKGHPMMAPVANQQGTLLAKNLIAMQEKKVPAPFKYFDKGSMATIGWNKAVLDVSFIHLSGFIAWMGWSVIHIFYLIGFRNKVIVFINWMWAYFKYEKALRLVIRPFRKS